MCSHIPPILQIKKSNEKKKIFYFELLQLIQYIVKFKNNIGK